LPPFDRVCRAYVKVSGPYVKVNRPYVKVGFAPSAVRAAEAQPRSSKQDGPAGAPRPTLAGTQSIEQRYDKLPGGSRGLEGLLA
jgi:hypothetical protein